MWNKPGNCIKMGDRQDNVKMGRVNLSTFVLITVNANTYVLCWLLNHLKKEMEKKYHYKIIVLSVNFNQIPLHVCHEMTFSSETSNLKTDMNLPSIEKSK